MIASSCEQISASLIGLLMKPWKPASVIRLRSIGVTDAVLAMHVAAPRDVWAVIRRGTGRAVIHGDGEAWAVSAAPLAAPTTLAGAAGVVWAGDASGAVAAYAGGAWTSRGACCTT